MFDHNHLQPCQSRPQWTYWWIWWNQPLSPRSLASLTACSDTPRNWTNTNQDSQKEMKLASWLSKLLAGAKIYWMLHPKMHPYRKPHAEPDSGGDPTEKRTVLPGEPANISQSPWKVLEVKEGKLADHTSSGRNEHQMRSFSKAGRTVRMVRMVRICQDSRYGEGGEDGEDVQ